MFHIGHLNIIRRAKENCDYLIVGVSTDECVQSYKNKTPVVPYNQRVAIIQAIKYVDKVVPQTSMDKFAAWDRLHFNRLFHGNDWQGSDMYNEIECKFKELGVEVIFFPHTDGISSTKLKQIINTK